MLHAASGPCPRRECTCPPGPPHPTSSWNTACWGAVAHPSCTTRRRPSTEDGRAADTRSLGHPHPGAATRPWTAAADQLLHETETLTSPPLFLAKSLSFRPLFQWPDWHPKSISQTRNRLQAGNHQLRTPSRHPPSCSRFLGRPHTTRPGPWRPEPPTPHLSHSLVSHPGSKTGLFQHRAV